MMFPVMNPAFYDVRALRHVRMSRYSLRFTTLNAEESFECQHGSLLRHVRVVVGPGHHDYVFGRRFLGMGASSLNGRWLGTMNAPTRIHP